MAPFVIQFWFSYLGGSRGLTQSPKSTIVPSTLSESLLLDLRADAEPATATNSAAAPCGIADPTTRDCENMKEVGGGMDGERYRCDVCGKGCFLDYEEM